MHDHIFKCQVKLGEGRVVQRDAIEYDDKLWIVTSWIQKGQTSNLIPERIVRFDDHLH